LIIIDESILKALALIFRRENLLQGKSISIRLEIRNEKNLKENQEN